MSSLTYQEAVDEMSTIFKDAWDTTGFDAFYESVREQRDTAEDPYVQFFIRHVLGNQASLAGGLGTTRYDRSGGIIANIFIPIGKGLPDAYTLAKVIADAYEGSTTPGGVWFNNVRINEIGRDGDFNQTNVLIDFTYYEIK